LEKKQQQLILGGWGWGYGSCGIYEASAEDNNYEGGGITGTGTNNPICMCNETSTGRSV